MLCPGQLLFLGTGTSYGVPMPGCTCAVCNSSDPRNRRLRTSAVLNIGGRNILIDCSPDFRAQALTHGLAMIDAVVITHVHADHVFGLDDLRSISQMRDAPIPVFTDPASAAKLRQIFDYVFVTDTRRPGIPWLKLIEVVPGTDFDLCGRAATLVPLIHGGCPTNGLVVGSFAYLTDFKLLPHLARPVLANLNLLILDMLRTEIHPTHLCLEEALTLVATLAPKRTWFIHMAHEVDHERIDRILPDGVRLAWDGLKLQLPSDLLLET